MGGARRTLARLALVLVCRCEDFPAPVVSSLVGVQCHAEMFPSMLCNACVLLVRGLLVLLAGLLALLGGPAAAAQEALTILHTSEHHGTVLPIEQRGQKRVAGMAGRATLISEIRRQTAALLVVDSGDILVGTPMSSLFRGEPDVQAMNLMGYQAMAAGNHEFDYGLDHLRALQSLAQFPILCSNLAAPAAELPCQASAVVRAGRLSIGLIGLLGRRNFPDTFSRSVAALLQLRDPVQTARHLARELKAQHSVDLVVALTHQETDEDEALLAQAPEIDVIIGGHTPGFDGLRSPVVPGPVAELENPGRVFVKTHRQGRTIGRLDVRITKGASAEGRPRIGWAKAENLPVTDEVAPDRSVAALIDRYNRQLEEQTAAVVGRALVALDGENEHIRTRETNLGNLLADLLRAEFGTEVALINAGQIRDSIPAGPVALKRVLNVLPFHSSTVTLSITGQQLRLALENSVSTLPSPAPPGRFLQVSGLTVTYDLSAPPGSRVREVVVGGRPLEPTQHYSVATDAFLADGGDGYAMLANAKNRIDRQVPIRDLLLAALRAGPLVASVDGRIRFVQAN